MYKVQPVDNSIGVKRDVKAKECLSNEYTPHQPQTADEK